MRQIIEYLSTKISANFDDIDKFPKNSNIETVIDFLDKNEFIYKKPNTWLPLNSFDRIIWFANNNHCKFYSIISIKNDEKLIFGNGKTISTANPLFIIYYDRNGDGIKFLKYMSDESILYKTYDEFRNEVNKFFNF